MNTEVICTLISVGGAREDIVSSDEEFAEMAAAVARYIKSHQPNDAQNAAEKVCSVRSKEVGKIAHCLDDLYLGIFDDDMRIIDECLDRVINQKRKTKCSTKGYSNNPPHK